MRRLVLALMIALSAPATAHSQGLGGGAGTCGTDWSDVAWDALGRFAEARTSGEFAAYQAARKASSPADIGDRRTFNVLEDLWTAREFELVDTTSLYHLWVAVADLGSVSTDEVTGLREAMLSATPVGSVDPSKGVLRNNLELFGHLPDFDGDGILDILMYDMKAGDGPTTVVLGYVSATDVLLGAPEGSGNQRDVLYLDAVEGSRDLRTLSSIAVHELTHLIHFAYLGVKREDTFIMEGLAEYAMIANGYDFRSAAYLTDTREYLLPMFSWRAGGGPNAFDYSRASLFFRYLGERIGPWDVASILRNYGEGGLGGSLGVGEVLTRAGYSLAHATVDFHTTNRFNDPSLDSLFAYRFFRGFGLPALPTQDYPAAGTRSGEFSLHGGAVEYLHFRNVQQIQFMFDTPNAIPANRDRLRAQIRARVVTEGFDGARQWFDLDPTDEPHFIVGPYRSVNVALVNVTGVSTSQTGVRIVFDLSWSAAPAGTATEDPLALDRGIILDPPWPNPASGPLNLRISGDGLRPVTITVFDLLGRAVLHVPVRRAAGSWTETIDAGTLPPGVYWVQAESDGARAARSFAIVR